MGRRLCGGAAAKLVLVGVHAVEGVVADRWGRLRFGGRRGQGEGRGPVRWRPVAEVGEVVVGTVDVASMDALLVARAGGGSCMRRGMKSSMARISFQDSRRRWGWRVGGVEQGDRGVAFVRAGGRPLGVRLTHFDWGEAGRDRGLVYAWLTR